VPLKSQLKSLANSALGSTGSRLVSESELAARSTQETRLADALFDVYAGHVFPDLPANAKRRGLARGLLGTEIPEAMFLLNYLHQALRCGPGDVVEMGVAQGATSALLGNELLRDNQRNLWLYDSFEGLSAPTSEDELIDDIEGRGTMSAYAGAMANPRALVEHRLGDVGFPAQRTTVVPGFVNASMPTPDVVAFAYLDFDLYEPILTGLRMIHPRARSGSVLMVDDYRYFSSGVETAVDEFRADHPEYELHPSPTWAGRFCALVKA
jgi:hypothetical protein